MVASPGSRHTDLVRADTGWYVKSRGHFHQPVHQFNASSMPYYPSSLPSPSSKVSTNHHTPRRRPLNQVYPLSMPPILRTTVNPSPPSCPVVWLQQSPWTPERVCVQDLLAPFSNPIQVCPWTPERVRVQDLLAPFSTARPPDDDPVPGVPVRATYNFLSYYSHCLVLTWCDLQQPLNKYNHKPFR